MDDYISRKSVTAGLDYIINELNKLITDDSPDDGYTDIKNQVEEIKRGVLNIPPEDVQPVVRCKDCKHRNDYAYWLGCPILNTDDDNFCSYAERRTDEPQHETRHCTHHSRHKGITETA